MTSAAEAAVTRLLSPGLETALQPFSDAAALAEGKVNAIALDAVVERFGPRWTLRREQVHEHVATTLDRHLGTQGFHLRISDTDFLVCQPDLPPLLGQAVCLRALRDILQHFLGQNDQADIGVHRVLNVSPSAVQAQLVDAHAARLAEAGAVAATEEAGRENDRAASVGIWTPFLTASGRRVNVSSGLDPVRELKGGSVIALRFARVVSDAQSRLDLDASELARLSRSDRLKIDVAVFDQGMSLLRAVPPSQRPPALIIPLSFSSLSNVDDRARMVSGLNEARGCVPQGIICELCDIEGVPAATLLGAVEVVRPFSLFVIGQVHELTAGQAHLLREARLHGVSVMCPPADSAAELDRWAQRSIRPAKKAVSGVLVYRAPSDAVARVLGATHASVRPA